jgi:pyruvate dehydrogenase E2 component (dihydrolipoamide acetyltransferase)
VKFEFPDTGEGVTEGQFLDWKVEEGDEVEEDQVVGEAETDKAVVEIPAPTDGTVKEIKAKPGDTVAVGDVIMIFDTGKEKETSETKTEESRDVKNNEKEMEEEQKISNPTANSSKRKEVLTLPKVRKLAEEHGIDLASIKTGERITEEEVREQIESDKPSEESDEGSNADKSSNIGAKARPSVRKLAREKEVDISQIEGNGRDGEVTREDVLQAAEGESTSETSKNSSTESTEEGEVERVKMNNIQRTSAKKMAESRFSAPHVTHVEKADLTELAELRNKEKDDIEVHLTYMPFIMKAALNALQEYPELNAEYDKENQEIVEKQYYNFNIAVDTERGLMVPVVDDVEDKSIIELAESVVNKAERAQNGDITMSEMQGGTFSITNVGVIGGEEFTPIINPPQTAILGLGRIQETAEVVDEEVVPRTTVKLSLSYDHRVIDGATAARFMNVIKKNLENPEKMLMEM